MVTFLELYTLTDTTTDFKALDDPFNISIRKWESIHNATQKIATTMGQSCGLCLRYQAENRVYNCEECPIDSCHNQVQIIQTLSNELTDNIKAFIEYLETEKEKHEQP